MTDQPSQQPNPEVAAFLKSTRWKLLLGLDVLTALGGAVGYAFTHNLLCFAPFAVVAIIVTVTLFRIAAAARGRATLDNGPFGK